MVRPVTGHRTAALVSVSAVVAEKLDHMKNIISALALLAALTTLLAQEKLSRDEALPYAKAVGSDLAQLKGTPLPTDVDLECPVAVKEEPYGGMVLPQKNLTADSLAKAGETIVPVGQLWLLRLAPMCEGTAVSSDSLRIARVQADGSEVSAPQCALGVRRAKSGSLELVVFGKGKEPIVTTALKAIESKQSTPLDLEAEREGDSGKLTVKLLGKYQASFSVTELEL